MMTSTEGAGTSMDDDRRPDASSSGYASEFGGVSSDAELVAIRRRVLEEIEERRSKPDHDDEPDPVLHDVLSGASWRELAAARDDLARARTRYTDAVRAARAVGMSWGEIGRVLGVSRQQLHRRFRSRD